MHSYALCTALIMRVCFCIHRPSTSLTVEQTFQEQLMWMIVALFTIVLAIIGAEQKYYAQYCIARKEAIRRKLH